VRARYQKGCLTKIKRKNGCLVWLFRWRETGSDGSRRPRNIVVGRVSELRTEADARRELETLRLNINLDPSEQARPPRNFRSLVDHYRLKELVVSKRRTEGVLDQEGLRVLSQELDRTPLGRLYAGEDGKRHCGSRRGMAEQHHAQPWDQG
jgi:hypothetical protein